MGVVKERVSIRILWTIQKSKNGYESEVTVYECEDCTGCPYKEKCTKAKNNKKLYDYPKSLKYSPKHRPENPEEVSSIFTQRKEVLLHV